MPEEKEHVIVIPLSAIRKARGLSGSQYDLWLYLYELDRYGKGIEAPNPDTIGQELGCHARTVFRNAQRLEDRELFRFEIKRWKAYNVKAKAYFSKYSPDKEIHLSANGSKSRTFRSQNGQFDPNEISEPTQDNGSENGKCTNNSKDFLNNKNAATGSAVVVPPDINKEAIGTTPQTPQLLERIINAGINPNKTIRRTLAELETQLTQEQIHILIRNALSAIAEQRERGNVRNPGGMLVAALRRGFTSNEAKREAKATTPAPDIITISLAIDQAMLRGDRPFALAKLQQLWADGHHAMVQELLLLRKDWPFSLNGGGVSDANQ